MRLLPSDLAEQVGKIAKSPFLPSFDCTSISTLHIPLYDVITHPYNNIAPMCMICFCISINSLAIRWKWPTNISKIPCMLFALFILIIIILCLLCLLLLLLLLFLLFLLFLLTSIHILHNLWITVRRSSFALTTNHLHIDRCDGFTL